MIGRLIDTDPSHFFHNEFINAGIMSHDEFLWTHGSLPGHIHIFDATGTTIEHIGRINLLSIKKSMCYVRDALPIRLKAMHVINTSPIVEIMFNMIKPFLNEEIINLVKLL